MNRYAEGREAYLEWVRSKCRGPLPSAPHPEGSLENREWETGFDDTMNYYLYDQYTLDDA